MTHGDKAKAKTQGKSSQASVSKKASSEKAVAKGGETGSKGQGKAAGKSGSAKSGETGKAAAVAEKAGAKGGSQTGALPKKAGGKDSGDKPRPARGAPVETAGPDGFSNPVIAGAYKHALKKYPNALRKLTD